MDEFPSLKKMSKSELCFNDKIDWKYITKSLKINFNVKEVDWIIPGEKAAMKCLNNFLENKFEDYYQLQK